MSEFTWMNWRCLWYVLDCVVFHQRHQWGVSNRSELPKSTWFRKSAVSLKDSRLWSVLLVRLLAI